MWDKPHLLRISATMLFGMSLAFIMYSALNFSLQLPIFKLRTVQLANAPDKVDVKLLNQVVKNTVGGSFFTVDLEKTRRSFEQLPWVRKVSVRRRFPWGLEVALEEHVPLARWNGIALVNTYGEVFAGHSDLQLPDFSGEPESAAQVAEMYAAMNKQLAVMHRRIAKISISTRYAWQLKLDDGMVLELGREQMQQRLERFVAVYPYSLATLDGRINYVDLRYRNGFAVNQTGGTAKAEMKIGSKRNSGSRV